MTARLGLHNFEYAITEEYATIESITQTHARQHTPRPAAAIEKDITQATELIAQIERKHAEAAAKALKIEAALLADLNKEKTRRCQEITKQIEALQFELGAIKRDYGYRRLDLSFLSKRRWSETYQCGYPLFAIFAINQPECNFTGSCRSEKIQTSAPDEAKDFFNLCELVRVAQHYYEQTSLKASFQGAIPDRVREKIALVADEFDTVYVISEAPQWVLNTVMPVPLNHLLLVGKWHGAFWLIESFDATPHENYVTDKFTSRIE
jgi:hypothetical protein